MKRSLYSLILSDEVVERIDALAASAGTNRSRLIDEILAEYVSLPTPAKRTRTLFEEIERLLGDLDVAYAERANTLSVRSVLNYRYRPTLKYDVELDGGAATLTVTYRTRSSDFDERMNAFFLAWTAAEKTLAPTDGLRYSICPGKWSRSVPYESIDYENAGRRVSGYVKTFDGALKAFLSGSIDEGGVYERYARALAKGLITA